MSAEIRKIQTGVAYPRNGNVGNPTRYFRWQVLIDGKSHGMFNLRRDAVAYVAGAST